MAQDSEYCAHFQSLVEIRLPVQATLIKAVDEGLDLRLHPVDRLEGRDLVLVLVLVELVQVEVDLGGAIGHLERVDMVSPLAGLDSLDRIRDPELAVEAVKLDAVGL